jgi:hypothetical protein
MSTENILLFSVFIVYTKTLQAVGEDSLAAFSFLFCHTAVRLKNRTVISGFILYSADSSLE